MKVCENSFNDEELKAVLRKSNSNEAFEVCPNCSSFSILYDTEDSESLKFLKSFLKPF